MSEALEIRPLTPADTPAVIDLLKASFGDSGVRWTEEMWTWKHRSNPFGPSPGLLAVVGGRPVALRVFLRWSFRAGSERATIPAVRAVDTVTHPDWRGRCLFTRLTRELVRQLTDEGTRFVFNTPNARSRPGYLRMGWRVAGRVPLLVRVRRPGRLPAALSARSERPLPDLSGFPPVAELLAAPETGWRSTPEPVDPLGDRLTTVRSIPYLRWRYREIETVPGFRYRSLWTAEGGAEAAVVFRARRRRALAEIDVAEVFLGSPDPGGARDLRGERSLELAAGLLRRLVRETDVDILAAVAAPDTPERTALRRAGFVPARWLAPRLTVLPLAGDPRIGDTPSADAWRWSLGDLELF
jgi:hypothetical protein